MHKLRCGNVLFNDGIIKLIKLRCMPVGNDLYSKWIVKLHELRIWQISKRFHNYKLLQLQCGNLYISHWGDDLLELRCGDLLGRIVLHLLELSRWILLFVDWRDVMLIVRGRHLPGELRLHDLCQLCKRKVFVNERGFHFFKLYCMCRRQLFCVGCFGVLNL